MGGNKDKTMTTGNNPYRWSDSSDNAGSWLTFKTWVSETGTSGGSATSYSIPIPNTKDYLGIIKNYVNGVQEQIKITVDKEVELVPDTFKYFINKDEITKKSPVEIATFSNHGCDIYELNEDEIFLLVDGDSAAVIFGNNVSSETLSTLALTLIKFSIENVEVFKRDESPNFLENFQNLMEKVLKNPTKENEE